MKYLSGMDNLFLAMDKGNQHLHVASLSIYDPSTAPGGKVRFKAILSHFSNRLNISKIFMFTDVQAAIGEHTVDIEYRRAHAAGCALRQQQKLRREAQNWRV